MEPLIGQIALFAFGRVPKNWMLCNGALLPISQYQALFALIGTTYGGNGTSTFALPDLRGRIPLHNGQGPGLSPYTIGEVGGQETVTLISSQMPMHSHALAASSANPAVDATATPSDQVVLATASTAQRYSVSPGLPAMLAMQSVGPSGGSQAHSNMMPSMVMNYCIAVTGIFPSRS